MRALTLHQPWASLIAHGIKTCETRGWPPAAAMLGERIAIHAAVRLIRLSELNEAEIDALERMLRAECGDKWQRVWPPGARFVVAGLPFGAVVATARLTGVVDGERATPDPYGSFGPGRWAWILDDVERLDPAIRARGQQGFWHWNPGEV